MCPESGTQVPERPAEPAESVDPAERRMQLRAFELWLELQSERQRAAAAELMLRQNPDLATHAALFDLSAGSDDPHLAFLGDQLAAECGLARHCVDRLSDLPGRSLLRRVADQYMGVLCDTAPIGFEAQCIGAGGATVLYRGILLPFTCEVRQVDYVYAVISWKSLNDDTTSSDLLLELDQVVEDPPEPESPAVRSLVKDEASAVAER